MRQPTKDIRAGSIEEAKLRNYILMSQYYVYRKVQREIQSNTPIQKCPHQTRCRFWSTESDNRMVRTPKTFPTRREFIRSDRKSSPKIPSRARFASTNHSPAYRLQETQRAAAREVAPSSAVYQYGITSKLTVPKNREASQQHSQEYGMRTRSGQAIPTNTLSSIGMINRRYSGGSCRQQQQPEDSQQNSTSTQPELLFRRKPHLKQDNVKQDAQQITKKYQLVNCNSISSRNSIRGKLEVLRCRRKISDYGQTAKLKSLWQKMVEHCQKLQLFLDYGKWIDINYYNKEQWLSSKSFSLLKYCSQIERMLQCLLGDGQNVFTLAGCSINNIQLKQLSSQLDQSFIGRLQANLSATRLKVQLQGCSDQIQFLQSVNQQVQYIVESSGGVPNDRHGQRLVKLIDMVIVMGELRGITSEPTRDIIGNIYMGYYLNRKQHYDNVLKKLTK